jgi:hypothetical protein
MPILTLDYDEFSALCDRLLGGQHDQPQRPPRLFGGGGVVQCRFRGRWFFASGGFMAFDRPGLRRRLGFPRSRPRM